MEIHKMAVLGAGAMGSQIAALAANHNIPVLLLDIVPKGANDRNSIAKGAIQKLKETHELHPGKDGNITPGNLEDDLKQLKAVDWVVECAPEKLAIKQETYAKAGRHIRAGVPISSNTSTIPLHELKRDMDDKLKQQLCITHFFNPPGRMPLLEVVADNDNDMEAIEALMAFADRELGKNPILVKDTPGFIANRIGIFWLLAGMEAARNQDIRPEEADAIMGKAFGFPKTGIFGLMDLIGIRLIPDIAISSCKYLPADDALCMAYDSVAMELNRLAGKERGFYRESEGKRQAWNIDQGGYHDVRKPTFERKASALLNAPGRTGEFTRHVLMRTLAYACAIAPDIADNITRIDQAMRNGYNWEKGPFELIDSLEWKGESGPDALIGLLECHDQPVPEFLKKAKGGSFYRREHELEYLGYAGQYRHVELPADKWTLATKTTGQSPVWQNQAGRLWDIGDGIACMELTTKLGTIGTHALELLHASLDEVESHFKGLIIGSDRTHFTAGLNIDQMLDAANAGDWERISATIHRGQGLMMRIKLAPFPVIPAISGIALGGGCELALHAPAAQLYDRSQIGLVEVDIGVIPAWGGSKEHIWRAYQHSNGTEDFIRRISAYFERIARAEKSANAEQALAMGLVSERSRISHNRSRLLPDAKRLCLELAETQTASEPFSFDLPTGLIRLTLNERLDRMQREENLPAHQHRVLSVLGYVLSAGETLSSATPDHHRTVTEHELLQAEHDGFMELIHSHPTQHRIEYMLENGKPLRN